MTLLQSHCVLKTGCPLQSRLCVIFLKSENHFHRTLPSNMIKTEIEAVLDIKNTFVISQLFLIFFKYRLEKKLSFGLLALI